MVTFDLGRVTTFASSLMFSSILIVVTFDLGRVTTFVTASASLELDCGDVRSRTSYNALLILNVDVFMIVVTFDLGRVTTI